MLFACINTLTNQVIKKEDFITQPPDIPHKNIKWLPYVDNPPPKLKIEGKTIDRDVTIKTDRVEPIYTLRDKTSEEEIIDVENRLSSLSGSVVFWRTLMDTENALRNKNGQEPFQSIQDYKRDFLIKLNNQKNQVDR